MEWILWHLVKGIEITHTDGSGNKEDRAGQDSEMDLTFRAWENEEGAEGIQSVVLYDSSRKTTFPAGGSGHRGI